MAVANKHQPAAPERQTLFSEEAAGTVTYKSLEWGDLDKQKFFLINPLVFMGLRVIQHPANVIKTRYQVQKKNSLYATTRSTVMQTLRHEGLRGFYRGFGTSSFMLVVQQIYILSYEFLRSKDRYSTLKLSESARNGIAAAVSVFAVQTIANPVDVLSQRLMLQGQLLNNAPMASPPPPSTSASVGPVASGAGASSPPMPPPQPGVGAATKQQPLKSGGLLFGSGSLRLTRLVYGEQLVMPRVLSAREIAVHVMRTHGLYGFYSGFFISCLQFIPSASIWWSAYPQYRDRIFLPAMQRAEAALQARSGSGWQQSGALGGSPTPSPAAADWDAAACRAERHREAVHAEPGQRTAHHQTLHSGSRANDPAASPAAGVTPARPTPGGLSSTYFARAAEIFSGSLASATVSVAMNPADIIRTRTQVEGSPALSVFRSLLASEGVRGLWKGTTARMAMLIPQGALSVWAYEFVKRLAAKPSHGLVDGEGGSLTPHLMGAAGPSRSNGAHQSTALQ